MSNEFSINILQGEIDNCFFAACDKLVHKWGKDHGQNPDKGIKAGAAPVSFNEVEKLTEEKYTIRKYKRILFYVVILVLLAAFF